MRLADLAAVIDARLIGDADRVVVGFGAVDDAGPDRIAFVEHAHDRTAARSTRAAAVIATIDFAADHADALPCAVLAVDDPGRALARALAALHPSPAPAAGVHPRAVVSDTASIDASAVIGPGAVVEAGVIVGPHSVIHPNAVLRTGVRLGARVRVGPGSIVGDDGFVTFAHGDANERVAHVGGVVIDDDVDIGAQVCIDRGLLGDTRIGRRCRIDNLVQIAHDVVLGSDVVVVAQAGIAGFARVGDAAVIAGQAGINPHVRIAPRVRVGGQAGVTHDIVTAGAAVAGTPAAPHAKWLKATAQVRRLASLVQRVRRLEIRLGLSPPSSA
jgi:UDP-3-O-[3-hydroxymyristoyl] glucosamine N-acyltransferase